MIPWIVFVFSIILLVFCIRSDTRQERKLWNNGKCVCGNKWTLFDNDIQKGRKYCCSSCGSCIYILWSADK